MEEYERYDKGELLKGRYLKTADISIGSYGLVSMAKDMKNEGTLVAVKCIYPLDYKRNVQLKRKETGKSTSSPANFAACSNGVDSRKKSILLSLQEEAHKEIYIHKVLGNHQNIVSLLDSFDHCLILEYCARGDLYEAVQSGNGPSISSDIKDVFHQILDALDYSHSCSVYHRDLKPENILIFEDWSIKICDWGLATTSRIIYDKKEFDVGSERYMAPELFDKDSDHYDASKIDIWSCGIILLTLVFHRNPFEVANYSDKRFVQFATNREFLFDIFSTMSSDMFSVVRNCLNIDPENRDLVSFRRELDSLRFFTIDEEYWASDGDYEDIDDMNHDPELGMEDGNVVGACISKADRDSTLFDAENVRRKSLPSSITISSDPDKEPVAVENKEKLLSKSSQSDIDESENEDILDIPHNHRADALLSSNTSKPIPIFNGTNNKRLRTHRKPFNVASYHHSFMNKIPPNNKFTRADFFTPKSMFSHYMDKYDKKRTYQDRNVNSKQGGRNTSTWKKHGKKRQTWKKNKKNNQSSKNNFRNQYRLHRYSHDPEQRTSSGYGKRKANFYNHSRPYSKGENNRSNTLYDEFAVTKASLLNSSGKYVPPYLKSPLCFKSPDVGPLDEELEALDLGDDDYDAVFQLDNDFGGNANLHIKSSTRDPLNSGYYSGRKSSLTAHSVLSQDSEHMHDYYSKSASLYLNHNRAAERRHSSILEKGTKPVPMPNRSTNKQPLLLHSASVTGKYIPPFKRVLSPKHE